MRIPRLLKIQTPEAAGLTPIPNPCSEFLREPNLLIPGKKPVGAVRIDWGHPLANRLTGCWLFRDTFLDEVSQKALVDWPSCSYTLPPFITTSKGRAIHINDWDVIPSIDTAEILSTGDNWTLAIVARPDEKAGITHLVGMKGGAEPLLRTSWGSNGFLDVNINSRDLTDTTPDVTGAWHSMSFSADVTGSRSVVYYDKELVDEQLTPVTSSLSDNRLQIGSSVIDWDTCSATWYQFDAKVSSLMVWDRTLTDGEHLEIHNDPYQLLIPA